ncbi:c-type cytochrome biogenesis protein CcmI [Afifella pfennigii]|uniref:c-type cytochrome biogenesis protein CcmI n=1 Tax=Afifella pfennigii TaxID=209897 RepID=UPI001AEC3E9D|nr:c-type cytochrome biogenesis protein CcmI [Afifella pfennigii]
MAIAVLTAVAILAVLVPLSREAKTVAPGAAEDAAVYRRQLTELEREREAGRIGKEEAEAARAEIARRLLAAEREAEPAADRKGGLWRRRATAIVALTGIPAVALAFYMAQGSPGMPDQPLQARLGTPSGENISLLVARTEEYLSRNPDDGQGWEILAPVYMRLGRPRDAARAYENAIRVLGSSTERQTNLGDALVMAAGGVVTEEARGAFQAAIEAAKASEEGAPEARFYLALAKQQEGDVAAAVKELRELLEGAPADAPWREAVQETIARLAGAQNEAAAALFQSPEPQVGPVARSLPETHPEVGSPAPAPAPAAGGPSEEEVAAAAEMAPEDRMAMIEGMVENLASRLEEQPDDAEGWLKLVRSYAVLGRKQDAVEAVRSALSSVSDQGGRREIAQLATDLGLPGMEELSQ